jgi:sphingolipid 4-desaturase/C4-monooxygenase
MTSTTDDRLDPTWFEPDRSSIVILIALTVFQWTTPLVLSWSSVKVGSWTWWIVVYVVGAVISHACMVLLHDAIHGRFTRSRIGNLSCALACSLPIGLPVTVPFMEYHRLHHNELSNRDRDPDVPMEWECRLFRGSIGKFMWILVQPLLYTIRPMLMGLPLHHTTLYAASIVGMGAWAIAAWWTGMGVIPVYCIASTIVSLSLHPCASHVLFEHYPLANPANGNRWVTFSYVGQWNRLFFNLGYHAVHHEEPRLAWRRLPAAHAKLHIHERGGDIPSLLDVWIAFLLDSRISLENRRKERPNTIEPSETITEPSSPIDSIPLSRSPPSTPSPPALSF